MAFMLATATCIVALSLGLFAELGGCTPVLTHNRRSLSSTSPDRNRVDLFCREDGSETLATFWNGNTQLVNSTPSATHIHVLMPETEAGIVCRNEGGDRSNEIRLAALPFDMQVQDDPPRVQCVRRGEEVQLPCEYPPGNLRELYSVQWRFRVNGSPVLGPPGFGSNGFSLPSGNLLSIDEDTFALTVAVDRLEQTGDQFHCDVNVRRNNIGTQQQTTVRYIGAIVELKVGEPVEIMEEVQDSRGDMGEPATFTCVATGTDVTISWEINGQSYTDCSNAGFCVRTTASGSMMVSSTITVNASLANNTRVLCRASQMCGTVFSTVSRGTLSFQASPPVPPPGVPPADVLDPSDDPALSEEVQTLIFVLSGIVAFIILMVLVLVSCVCSLRILYNRGKISTESRVIRNRPLLQRMISGDRIPRVTAVNGHRHDHDYEYMDAELGSINAHDGGSGYVDPRSDVSDQERVSQIYNWSRESGGSSNVVPNHLARGTPSISIAGSQPSLQQPFNRTSYAESESEFYQKLIPNTEGTQSTGNLSASISHMSPPLAMMPPGSPKRLSPIPPTIPESASPSPLADEILRYVVGCLMHRRDCQIPRCPCKDVQQRYQEMLTRDTDTAREPPKPPPCDGKKHHLHLSLSQQNLGANEHPHWHLHTKSYLRHTQRPPILRQRSKSVDLTPIIEARETPVIEKRLTPAPIDENRVLRRPSLTTRADCDSPDGPVEDPNWRPPLLREISISADNLPALCLNNCPLTPSPLRENRTLAATAMSPLREQRSRWLHKPKLGILAENSQSAESSSEDGSNTSSRSNSAASVVETNKMQVLVGNDSPPVPVPSQLHTSTSVPESGYDTNCSDTEGNSDKLSRKQLESTQAYTLPHSPPPTTQRNSRSNSSPPPPTPVQLQERSPTHRQQNRQHRERSPAYQQQNRQHRERSPAYQQKYSPAHLGPSPTHQSRGRDARGRSPLHVSEATVTETLC